MKVNQIVGHCLKREGVKFLTGFPYNQVIDACADLDIRPIIARSERVAINIADGYSRMSANQEFGVSAVQYGPGVENSFGAIAQAYAIQLRCWWCLADMTVTRRGSSPISGPKSICAA